MTQNNRNQEKVIGKLTELQDSLNSLTLIPWGERQNDVVDQTLVGKLLTTRSFRRYTLAKIINKMWKLEAKVYIEKIEENIFKYNFGNCKDKEKIFQNRPWTVNGALLILKE